MLISRGTPTSTPPVEEPPQPVKKRTPRETRYEAVKSLMEQYISPEGELKPGVDDSQRFAICREISALRALGRTERWSKAITTWQVMVRDMDNDLRWALVQGQMFPLWADC